MTSEPHLMDGCRYAGQMRPLSCCSWVKLPIFHLITTWETIKEVLGMTFCFGLSRKWPHASSRHQRRLRCTRPIHQHANECRLQLSRSLECIPPEIQYGAAGERPLCEKLNISYVSAAARHEVLLLNSVTPNYSRVIEQNWMML